MGKLILFQGLFLVILVDIVRSTSVQKFLNTDFLKDIRRLNIGDDVRRLQSAHAQKLPYNKEDDATTIMRQHGVKNNSDFKRFIAEEKTEEPELDLDENKFKLYTPNTKEFIVSKNIKAHDGDVYVKETTLADLNVKHSVAQGTHSNLVNIKESTSTAIDHNENRARLNKEFNKIKEQNETTELQVKHTFKENDTEVQIEQENNVGENKAYVTGMKMTLFDRSTTWTPHKTLHNTTEKVTQHQRESANSINDRNILPKKVFDENSDMVFTKHKSNFASLSKITDITENTNRQKHPTSVKAAMINEFGVAASNPHLKTMQNKKIPEKPLLTKTVEMGKNNIYTVTNNATIKSSSDIYSSKLSQNLETNVFNAALKLKTTKRNDKGSTLTESSKHKLLFVTSSTTGRKRTRDHFKIPLNKANVVNHTKDFANIEITTVDRLLSGKTMVERDSSTFDLEKNTARNTDGKLLDNPCQHTRNTSKLYSASALVAAAVGGVLIGAFAVFLLFHFRQKCKNYVNGNYQRVPLEYDFELNPRFKSH